MSEHPSRGHALLCTMILVEICDSKTSRFLWVKDFGKECFGLIKSIIRSFYLYAKQHIVSFTDLNREASVQLSAVVQIKGG